MSVTVQEKFDSRDSVTGGNASVDLTYIIKGTDDDLAAKAALEAEAPASYDLLSRRSCEIEYLGPEMWLGLARYARDEITGMTTPPETGESAFSFDTGGGTQHITQSLQTIARIGWAGDAAPDRYGAIGYTNGEVEGVDIIVPIYYWGETHYLADSVVTQAYRRKLFDLTGTVNDDDFKGMKAGECLFCGAAGSKRGEADWEVNFRFASSPNKTDWLPPSLEAAGFLKFNKKGWEYMWIDYYYKEVTGILLKRPRHIYIEKVYENGDLSGLEIGV